MLPASTGPRLKDTALPHLIEATDAAGNIEKNIQTTPGNYVLLSSVTFIIDKSSGHLRHHHL